MRDGRVERDGVAGPELVVLEPDGDPEAALEHDPELPAGVPHECVGGSRLAPGRIDGDEELDVALVLRR